MIQGIFVIAVRHGGENSDHETESSDGKGWSATANEA